MGIVFSDFTGGSSKLNNFAINVGASGNNVFELDRTYSAGSYSITFTSSDTVYDVYAVSAAGQYAGYANQSIIEITENFDKIVILGAETNDQIFFEYRGTTTFPTEAGTQPGAGPYVSSVVTSSLPNIDDTTVINGGNFAENIEIYFIGQDTTESAAKNVVRNTATQLIVTRPDTFSPDNSPYTIKAVNPGVPLPSSTESYLLSNSVTAGTNPSWTTPTDIYYNVGGATSITLLATDTEGSDIDYSLVSGTLPAGLTLDEETGVINGTFSGAANEGDLTNITVRATDAGGNFLDKAFNLTANTAPTWTTTAGAIGSASPAGVYSFQLVASTGSAGGTLAYSLQIGTLPTGLTLDSNGLISGTSSNTNGDNFVFTVRVTDEGGLFVDREFSILIVDPTPAGFVSYTDPSTLYGTYNQSDGQIHSAIVGADGSYYAGTKVLANNNAYELVLSKYEINGTLAWSRRIHDSSNTNYRFYAMRAHPSGGVMLGADVAGSNYGSAVFVDTSGNISWQVRGPADTYARGVDFNDNQSIVAVMGEYISGNRKIGISTWNYPTGGQTGFNAFWVTEGGQNYTEGQAACHIKGTNYFAVAGHSWNGGKPIVVYDSNSNQYTWYGFQPGVNATSRHRHLLSGQKPASGQQWIYLCNDYGEVNKLAEFYGFNSNIRYNFSQAGNHAIDASDNIYMTDTNGSSYIHAFKMDNSFNPVWARSIYIPGWDLYTGIYNFGGQNLEDQGDVWSINVLAKPATVSNDFRMITINLAADGSDLGTQTLDGMTITISTSAARATSASGSNSISMSQNSGSGPSYSTAAPVVAADITANVTSNSVRI